MVNHGHFSFPGVRFTIRYCGYSWTCLSVCLALYAWITSTLGCVASRYIVLESKDICLSVFSVIAVPQLRQWRSPINYIYLRLFYPLTSFILSTEKAFWHMLVLLFLLQLHQQCASSGRLHMVWGPLIVLL